RLLQLLPAAPELLAHPVQELREQVAQDLLELLRQEIPALERLAQQVQELQGRAAPDLPELLGPEIPRLETLAHRYFRRLARRLRSPTACPGNRFSTARMAAWSRSRRLYIRGRSR